MFVQSREALTKPLLPLVGAACLAFGVAAPAFAASLSVDATTDIWLSGQPDGTEAIGYFGSDFAPANSPVLVQVLGGTVLSFTAAGSTTVDGSCFAGADGGCYADESGFGVGPANGIGTYKGPSNALIGVFVNAATPAGTGGPASLDFTDPAAVSASNNSPQLNQIFFIGDGLTGTGSGTVQKFAVPSDATRLFLAVADSYGSSTGNSGSLAVTVQAVPEPQTLAMLLAGLGVVGLRLRRRAAR